MKSLISRKKNYIRRRIFYNKTNIYSPLIIPYNYYWMWYIIEEKDNFFREIIFTKIYIEEKKEAIVLFIEEEKKHFSFILFSRKNNNQCGMSVIFWTFLKFEQTKNKKYFFPPAVQYYAYTNLFFPYHGMSLHSNRAASVI